MKHERYFKLNLHSDSCEELNVDDQFVKMHPQCDESTADQDLQLMYVPTRLLFHEYTRVGSKRIYESRLVMSDQSEFDLWIEFIPW